MATISTRSVKTILGTMLIASALANGCAHPMKGASSSETASRNGSTEVYTAVGSGHFVRSVTSDGQSIVLEDGSSWQVEPGSRYTAADWQPDAPVTVRPARSTAQYPYELTNTQDDEAVLARLVSVR